MRVGAKYRHYKGGDYEIVDLSFEPETSERQVTYRREDGSDETWTCSLASFLKIVELDGRKTTRFRRI